MQGGHQATLEQTVEILKTPPAQRAEIQISFLQQETNQIGLFSQYKDDDGDNELHRLCCLYMKHEFIRKEQMVFNIDDVGTKFYIIISGRVGVLIRMPKARRSELILESNGNLNPTDQVPLQMVKELRTGDSFGELALMKNQKRLASIVCLEDCHFGVIDKKIFNLALKEKEEEKLNTQMRFLANSPIFASINKNIIKILHMNSFYVSYLKNQPVFQEGQKPNACYIIKSGEFTIYKRFDRIQNSLYSEQKSEYLTAGSKQFEIKLCVLGKGELFGEHEIITNENRKSSAVCSSLDGGELMIISRSDLEGRVLEDSEHRKTFLAYSELKQHQLTNMIQGAMNQLHKYQQYRFTSKLPHTEIGICEKLRNKNISAPAEEINTFLNSNTEESDLNQINLGSRRYLRHNNHHNQHQVDDQEYQDASHGKNNNHHSSIMSNHIENNGQHMQHITKNSEQILRNKLFGKKEQQEMESEGASSPGEEHRSHRHSKSTPIMRIELNSYTKLKAGIRKKTAIALSKQFRQPYEVFMAAGRMYDISQSDQQDEYMALPSSLSPSLSSKNKLEDSQRNISLSSSSMIKSNKSIELKASLFKKKMQTEPHKINTATSMTISSQRQLILPEVVQTSSTKIEMKPDYSEQEIEGVNKTGFKRKQHYQSMSVIHLPTHMSISQNDASTQESDSFTMNMTMSGPYNPPNRTRGTTAMRQSLGNFGGGLSDSSNGISSLFSPARTEEKQKSHRQTQLLQRILRKESVDPIDKMSNSQNSILERKEMSLDEAKPAGSPQQTKIHHASIGIEQRARQLPRKVQMRQSFIGSLSQFPMIPSSTTSIIQRSGSNNVPSSFTTIPMKSSQEIKMNSNTSQQQPDWQVTTKNQGGTFFGQSQPISPKQVHDKMRQSVSPVAFKRQMNKSIDKKEDFSGKRDPLKFLSGSPIIGSINGATKNKPFQDVSLILSSKTIPIPAEDSSNSNGSSQKQVILSGRQKGVQNKSMFLLKS